MAKDNNKSKSAKQRSAEVARKRDEARRRAAAQRRARAEAQERRKRLLTRVRKIGMPILAGVAVFAAAILLITPTPEVPGVTRVDVVEGDALAAGATHAYETPTPTSGPYAPEVPACGIYEEPLPLTEAVAALRIGVVVIWHQPGTFTTELADYASRFDSHVIVSPNPDLEDPVVATAFLRRKAYGTMEQLLDDDFAGIYRSAHGAEEGACPMTAGTG